MLRLPLLLRAPVAQLDRASACGAEGRRFESCQVYQDEESSYKEAFSLLSNGSNHLVLCCNGCVRLQSAQDTLQG